MNIIATIRRWHIELYRRELPFWDGDWRLVTEPKELEALVLQTTPRYIFFPHWSWRVPEWMWRDIECVNFHETALPFGRGGSPIQNLILRGHTDTVITAHRMVEEIDAGPIYLVEGPLSLLGTMEEIGVRSAPIIMDMIKHIAVNEPEPKPQQERKDAPWPRRNPTGSALSIIDHHWPIRTLSDLYDVIRMLDAEGYPRAYMGYGLKFKIEFSRATLRADCIEANVRITEERQPPKADRSFNWKTRHPYVGVASIELVNGLRSKVWEFEDGEWKWKD